MTLRQTIQRHATFGVTIIARGVSAVGAILFFALLATDDNKALSRQVAVDISWISLSSYIASLGLGPVALRFLARTHETLHRVFIFVLLRILLSSAAVAAIVSVVVYYLTAGGSAPDALTICSIAIAISVNSARTVLNDVLRGLGFKVIIAWFEFGQVLAATGLTAYFIGMNTQVNRAGLSGLIALFSVIVLIIQVYLLCRHAIQRGWFKKRFLAPTSRLTSIVLRYWREIGLPGLINGLLGSGSRDIFIICYALGGGGEVAEVSLALRIWEGLSIPLVAAYSDLSAGVISRNAPRRYEALEVLRQRVRLIFLFTVTAAVGLMIVPHTPFIKIRRMAFLISPAILTATCARVITGALGLPSALLALQRGALRATPVAAIQTITTGFLVLLLGKFLDPPTVVGIWSVGFILRTIWEASYVRRAYGLSATIWEQRKNAG